MTLANHDFDQPSPQDGTEVSSEEAINHEDSVIDPRSEHSHSVAAPSAPLGEAQVVTQEELDDTGNGDEQPSRAIQTRGTVASFGSQEIVDDGDAEAQQPKTSNLNCRPLAQNTPIIIAIFLCLLIGLLFLLLTGVVPSNGRSLRH